MSAVIAHPLPPAAPGAPAAPTTSGAPAAPAAAAIARANARLANRNTPFIRQCWYVAGWSGDFTRQPLERTLLGTSLVFYRTEAGQPVALRNRCPHRSFPLVHGVLEGDALRCGYHGLLFGPDGRCTDVPSQPSPPVGVCTPAYRLEERGPLVWIWMGDEASADPAAIPATDWLESPRWAYAQGQLHVRSSYVYLHENLLDLSHFTFLHPTTLGTPEYAAAPYDVAVDGDVVHVCRKVEQCDVPPIYLGTGFKGKMSRQTDSEFITPAMHHASAIMKDLSGGADPAGQCTTFITHFLTPETPSTTHYWFTFARDFALADGRATEFMKKNAYTAFQEDLHALEEIERMYGGEPQAMEQEIHVRADQPGIAARRILRSLAEREAGRP